MTVQLTAEQQARADKLARISPAEWDAICKRCGICCLIKVKINTQTLYLRRCCDKFNPKTRECGVYETRLGNSCCRKVDMDVILAGKLLPASCGYVEYIFGPAPFPARVDFSSVRPISSAQLEKISSKELLKDVISGSLSWSARRR